LYGPSQAAILPQLPSSLSCSGDGLRLFAHLNFCPSRELRTEILMDTRATFTPA
jgi:hypothetical protein